MKPNQRIDNRKECDVSFNRRIRLVYLLCILSFLMLISRLFFLQVIEHKQYLMLSEKNHIILEPVTAQRGLIYDRNGQVLVENKPLFNIRLMRNHVENIDEQLKQLQEIISLPSKNLKRLMNAKKHANTYPLMTVKSHLSDEEVARFSAHQEDAFPAFTLVADTERYYPYGELLGHVLGYVRSQHTPHRNETQSANHFSSFEGKSGIEASENNELKGAFGFKTIEIDAKGRTVRIIANHMTTPGSSIHLTLDLPTQRAADKALGKHQGAVVAIDPQTGGLLAMVSHPNFDPNHLNRLHGYSMFNRALSGQYPPGSTIKPFIALGALSNHTIENDTYIDDPGYYKLPTAHNVYRDWDVNGHGRVTVSKAIQVSCDTFFYVLGRALGIHQIDSILTPFGFGQPVGLDGERLGLLPSPKWKRLKKHETWYVGDTIITGIGQGFFLTTPLQLSRATAIFAMRGKSWPIHWVHTAASEKNQPIQAIQSDKAMWDTIISAMEHALIEGTGYRFGHASYRVAGKTGTVQLVRHNQSFNDKNLPVKLQNHSLFIAFAPINHPKIAVSVLVENHGGAIQIARTVMDAYLNRPLLKEHT
jgi:penicillin-binding protein 2